MFSAVFEPAMPASEPPQTHTLDRSAIEIESFLQLVLSCIGNQLLVIVPDFNKVLFNHLVLIQIYLHKVSVVSENQPPELGPWRMYCRIYFRVPCNSLRHRLMESCAVTTWSYPVFLVSLFFFLRLSSSGFLLFVFLVLAPMREPLGRWPTMHSWRYLLSVRLSVRSCWSKHMTITYLQHSWPDF